MKKQVIIISGIILAVMMGVAFYIISIPNDSSAAIYTGSHEGNYCKFVDSNGVEATGVCSTDYTAGGTGPGWLFDQDGTVACTEGGGCEFRTSTGSYGGTLGSDVYFNQATATAFMQQGGTQQQVDAIDGIYVACQNLLASKPTDGGMDPRGVSCGDYKWDCRPGYGLACKNIDNDNWVGNPNQPDTTRCADIQPGTGGGECGGQRPNCGLTTGGGIIPIDVNTINASTRSEFDPLNPGFGSKTLRLGDKGSEVLALQKFLIATGYSSVTADGSFGVGTEGALKHWQGQNKLVKDGVFGSQARSIALTAAAGPSVNRGLWCQGTWQCSGGSKQCVTNSPANCTVYCVPETAPANPVCTVEAR